MKNSALVSLHRVVLATLAAGVLAAPAPHARAALAITDQQNTLASGTSYGSIGSASPLVNYVGQSFTPTLTAMNAATFSIDAFTATATLTLNVYAGAGFGGTLLGTSAPVIFSNTNLQTIEFDLPSLVVLTPGSTYTLGLSSSANSGFFVNASSSNSYAGGTLYLVGTSRPDNDAVFAEGIAAPSTGVPEPSTWAALALGAGLLGVVTLRRRVSRA